jgi:hypothetical protein
MTLAGALTDDASARRCPACCAGRFQSADYRPPDRVRAGIDHAACSCLADDPRAAADRAGHRVAAAGADKTAQRLLAPVER